VAAVVLVGFVTVTAACAGHGTSRPPGTTAITTTTDELDSARAQLDDIDRQLGQAADDSRDAGSGPDDTEGDPLP
jgi:hypothetical protein